MKLYHRIIFLTLLSLISVNHARACDCPELTFEESFENANVVFKGTVAEVATNWVSGGLKITFSVEKSWKRSVENYTTINTPVSNNCGYPFVQGETYIVWVNKKFSLQTTACERTQPWVDAGEDIEKLGAGISSGTSEQAKTLILMTSVLVIGGFLFLGIVIFRKKIFKSGSKD